MRLFEHPEFQQAILNAAEAFTEKGMRPALIEKDYFVTEALRSISHAAFERVIFKGGTSLSKGWNLIDRFSDDIDLFLDPTAFTPQLGKKGIDRELKKLRDQLDRHPALSPKYSVISARTCSVTTKRRPGIRLNKSARSMTRKLIKTLVSVMTTVLLIEVHP